MDELIAKLEAATAGSRELDAEIAALMGHDHGPCEVVHYESRSVDTYTEIAAHYTTSLDTALTLVPEGWRIQLFQEHSGALWLARLIRVHDRELVAPFKQDSGHVEEKSSPALALCIAALRACANPKGE